MEDAMERQHQAMMQRYTSVVHVSSRQVVAYQYMTIAPTHSSIEPVSSKPVKCDKHYGPACAAPIAALACRFGMHAPVSWHSKHNSSHTCNKCHMWRTALVTCIAVCTSTEAVALGLGSAALAACKLTRMVEAVVVVGATGATTPRLVHPQWCWAPTAAHCMLTTPPRRWCKRWTTATVELHALKSLSKRTEV